MRKIEFKITIMAADATNVTVEVIKQAIEDAMLAVGCDRNMCYEVTCTHDGELEQAPSIPISREVHDDKTPHDKWVYCIAKDSNKPQN